MEDRYQHTVNGQSVLQADLNTMGEAASIADDRVLAELLRMLPYNGSSPSRGILPFAYEGSGRTGTVAPNGATGAVLVNPFRAVIGPRTAVATDAKKNWRDTRSAIGVGSTTLAQTVSIAANSSGNPRWDLVYAAVAIDANSPTVTRKVKNPVTKVIASQSVVNVIRTTVTLGVLAGTAAAAPVWPSAPADSGGVYYVPLAYVCVLNGFGASSTVLPTDIAAIANILRLSRSTGASTLQVADQHYATTSAQQQAWGSTGTRPKVWMPPEMSGKDDLVVAMDLTSGSSANWSHQTGGVVDSRDWRGRICKSLIMASSVLLDGALSWNATVGGQPSWNAKSIASPTVTRIDDEGVFELMLAHSLNESSLGTNKAYVAEAIGSRMAQMADGTFVQIYCDMSDGKLKVDITGVPLVFVFFWLEFTGPYTNK